MKFALKCLEISLTQWIKCTYRELRSVSVLKQKFFYCANGGHKQHLFLQDGFPFDVYRSVANTNSKEQALLIDQDRGKPWIQIFWYYWGLRSSWYHSKWHQRKPRVMLCSLFLIYSNRWVMLCSYSPINDSWTYATKLLAYCRGYWESEGLYIKSWWVSKFFNMKHA